MTRSVFWLLLGSLTSLACLAADQRLRLSSEQQSYLDSLRKISLCVGPKSMPLDGIENGRHVGMGGEYMRVISGIIDMPFQLIVTSTWQQSLDNVKQGRCDIIALAAKTPNRETYLDFTEPFVIIPFVVVTTGEKLFLSKLEKLAGKTLGVRKGYAHGEFIRLHFPKINLVEVNTLNQGFKLVSEGEIYGYLMGLYVAGYSIQTEGYSNLKVNGQFDELSVTHLGIGVRKNIPHLRDILNKAIAMIDPLEKKRIDNSWVTIRYQIAESYNRITQFGIAASIIILLLFYRQFYLRKHNRQLEESEKKVWHQANFDILTGLPNRRYFQSYLEQKPQRTDREEEAFALLLIDLDEFKEINDTLGHDQGDKLLIKASARIRNCLRSSDVVARLGGDEFVVVLNNTQQKKDIEVVTEKLLSSLQTPYLLEDKAFISASIGVTLFPKDSSNMVDLLKNADQAMYAAKASGRNNFHYFLPSMRKNAMKRMMLVNDLRMAIAKQQFELFYQPIIDLKNKEIIKAEALIRWNHPDKGYIAPIDFIPLLEETRMIIEVGEWVLIETAKQVKKWREHYNGNFQINVNTSAIQFQSNSTHYWPDRLAELKVTTASIGIEITESMLMEGHDNISGHLLSLRQSGFQISLDDFGTGYSSLSYLKKFDIDYLKIDKSFVDNISSQSNELILCEAIIIMAHKLGLLVVAEGIENQAQCDLLIHAGCDFAQGYLFSKPLPAKEFEQRFLGSTKNSQFNDIVFQPKNLS